MKRLIKTTCFLMVLLTIISLVPIKTQAIDKPNFKVGPVYKQSAYYRRLLALELTGDQRYDFVSVALSQLGYHEGNSDRDMDGMNIEGNKNFVEYTRVYGRVDNQEGNGVSYGYEWCAAFVSWCLRQAGVSVTNAVTEISCGRMTNWYVGKNAFFESGSYLPLAGDIIMFHDDDGPSHVGLVLGLKNGKVYTVEGNNGGKVDVHSYDVNSDYIYGYCVPVYETVEGADYAALLEANINPAGKYIINTKSLNVRAEPNTTSEILGELTSGDTVTVTEFSGKWGKIDYNGKEAWISTTLAIQEKFMIYTVEYNTKGGTGGVEYQRKLLGDRFTVSKSVPSKKGYKFMGWDTDTAAKTVVYKAGDQYTADENATLYAVWQPWTYTVTFYNDDGSVIKQSECKYQDKLEVPEDPVKAADGEFMYTFCGWDSELADVVVKDLEYTATYTQEAIPKKPLNLPLIIGVSAGVLLLLAAAVAIPLINKRRNKA